MSCKQVGLFLLMITLVGVNTKAQTQINKRNNNGLAQKVVNHIEGQKIKQENKVSIVEENLQDEYTKDYVEIDVELSFYSDLLVENSIHGSIDACGNKLKYGTVACAKSIPFGTEFTFDYFGEDLFICSDRGSNKYIKIENNIYYIDVLIERNTGESDTEYYNRVNNMGRVRTKGKMYKK